MPEKNGKKKKQLSPLARVGVGVLVFAGYFATGVLGLRFNAVSGFATLLWAPTGIALATLLFLGYGLWPAIALGAFATNLVTGAPVLVALGIAAGNTLEALAGTFLLKRAKFSPKMDGVRHTFAFIGYAALLSTLASATVGVASLYFGGLVAPDAIARTWTAWWVGDVLGDLVFGALIIVVVAAGRRELRLKGSREAFGLCATLLAVTAFVFAGPFSGMPLTYLVLLPMLWAALRFEQLGTVLATFAVMAVAVVATAFGAGPFARANLSEGLVFLQFFIGIVAATKLVVSGVVSERRNALEEVRGFNRDLEGQVVKRTLQLSRTNEELKRADESLSERHAILQAVLRGIGEGVLAVDTAGNPIVFNPAALNIMGLQMNEAPSRLEKYFAMFPAYYPDGRTEVPMEDRPITRALRGETTENEQLLIKSPAHPQGVLVSCTGTPIMDDKGQRIGGVVVFHEIPK